MTPYQAITGLQPDLTKLRIFGSQASAKKPGSRSYKLDDNSFQGVFLGTTAKDTNCYIHDTATKRVKIGTHTIFDEAHMSIPASKAPLAAQALQRLGYHQKESLITDKNNKESAENTVQVQLLQHRHRGLQPFQNNVSDDQIYLRDGPHRIDDVPIF